jgi:hypothetical protein
MTYVMSVRRIRLGNRTARISVRNHISAYSVRRTAQFSAVERSESPYAPIMVNNTRGSQSSGQSQSSGRMIAGGPGPRKRAGSCGGLRIRHSTIQQGNSFWVSIRTETYKLSDGSSGEAHGNSGSEWCELSPRRDRMNGGAHGKGKGDGGAHGNGGSEWQRRPQTRTHDPRGRDDGVSIAVSSAGSGGSRSA